MKSISRRLGATIAGGALATTALAALSVAPAQAAPSTAGSAAANAALTWLDTQYLGLGQQADMYVGLGTLDGTEARRSAIEGAFRDQAPGYINSDYTWNDVHYTGISSGAIAKTLAVAAEAGDDVSAYGGETVTPKLDLVDLLADRTTAAGPSAGRLADEAFADGVPDPYGNYANTFGQAWAVRGLAAADTTAADALLPTVQSFLLDQQCADGYFRLYFNTDAAATNQSCDDASPAETTPGADTTALVLILLDDLAAEDPTVATALDKAEAWLLEQQLADGSFPAEEADGGAQPAPNTNTVGLAGWALGVRGQESAATQAATWVRGRQLTGTDCDGAAKAHRGAIAFTDAGLTDGLGFGIDDVAWEWAGATAQAFPVLAWAPEATRSPSITVPAFAKSGSTVTATVAGVPAGARACVDGGATQNGFVANGGTQKVSLKVGTSTKTVSLGSIGVAASAKITVLGAKKLKPLAKNTLKRGSKQAIKVKGLAKGEQVVVKLAGKRVAKGKANSNGVFKATFKVKAKKGKTKLVVTGQFANRTGVKKVTVK